MVDNLVPRLSLPCHKVVNGKFMKLSVGCHKLVTSNLYYYLVTSLRQPSDSFKLVIGKMKQFQIYDDS